MGLQIGFVYKIDLFDPCPRSFVAKTFKGKDMKINHEPDDFIHSHSICFLTCPGVVNIHFSLYMFFRS